MAGIEPATDRELPAAPTIELHRHLLARLPAQPAESFRNPFRSDSAAAVPFHFVDIGGLVRNSLD
jgi:hypothetical protein